MAGRFVLRLSQYFPTKIRAKKMNQQQTIILMRRAWHSMGIIFVFMISR